ncbi:MAG TPA: GtrA family protein [Candidatus Sulfotelmatobacter sp.]|nr:GtrA family protein [Candidatus Sulfotelmatobacter sp.]
MTTAALPMPRGPKLIRYLVVGGCNTVFGYGCYALFTALLSPLVAHGYILASLLANLLSITFAFLGYKWFVFKTEGNYLREWVRCLGVYAGSMVLSSAALPFVVAVVRRGGHDRSAPYIAGGIVLGFSILFSFFGHSRFSFGGGKRGLQGTH